MRFELRIPLNTASQSMHSIDATARSTLTDIDPAATGILSSAKAPLAIVLTGRIVVRSGTNFKQFFYFQS